uniref:Ribosomal protein L34 n=1 Tax=Halydictyon mirabile TaxID=189652 RepID=A0A4D6WWN7_9FLOR|nr:ribosomal protein L34 [Halydictyon mirabile]
MNQGTKIKRTKKSGFRARLKTKNGKKILAFRRRKKRHKISL